MAHTPSPAELLAKMSPEQRHRAADALAISHRFKAKPHLKNGQPYYLGRTAEQIGYYKTRL